MRRQCVQLLSFGLMATMVLGACGTPVTSPPATVSATSSAGTGQFVDAEMAFDYPTSWNTATFEVVSSFFSVIVFLSTATLSDPCVRTPTSRSCAWSAVSKLEPDGVYLVWYHRGFPGWTFDASKGQPLTVGGRHATLARLEPSQPCEAIGGERELLVTIDNPGAESNWNELQACLRGPAIDTLEHQVEAMIASVRWGVSG